MSTADHAAPTTLELVRYCHAAADRSGRAPADVDASDTAFFAGYLLSAIAGLVSADPSDPHAPLHAARAIAVYVAAGPDAYANAELVFSGLTDSSRSRLARLLERVGR